MTYRPICITGVAGSGKDTFSLHLMAAAMANHGVHPVVVALGALIKQNLYTAVPAEWARFSNWCLQNGEDQALVIRVMKIPEHPLHKDEPLYRPILEAWGLCFWDYLIACYRSVLRMYDSPLICVRPCQPEEIDFWRKQNAYWVHIVRTHFKPATEREAEWDKDWRALADRFVLNAGFKDLHEIAGEIAQEIYGHS